MRRQNELGGLQEVPWIFCSLVTDYVWLYSLHLSYFVYGLMWSLCDDKMSWARFSLLLIVDTFFALGVLCCT